jgi:hypothetical protein
VGAKSAAGACARCHAAEQLAVNASLHAAPFAKLGLSSCTPCHEPHDTPVGSTLLLGLGPEGSCARCHAGQDAALPGVLRFSARVRESLDAARRARTTGAAAELLVPTVSLGAWVELARAERALRVAAHGCDEAALGGPLAALDRTSSAIAGRARSAAWLTPGLVVSLALCLMVLLGLTIWAGVLLRRRMAGRAA